MKNKSSRSLIRNLLVLSAVRAMGGQAVLNGVMMRGENSYAVAVRRMDDSIDLKTFDVPSFAQKFGKIPLLRGVMGLGEAMALGYRALMHSADLMIKDEQDKILLEEQSIANSIKADDTQDDPSSSLSVSAPLETESVSASNTSSEVEHARLNHGSRSEQEEKNIGKFTVGMSITFSLVFFVGLFILAPLLASKWIEGIFGLSHWQAFIAESVLRLTIFLGYLLLVSLMPDIKRVFQYHGAEHKAIAAYENNVVLTPESAQQFTTAHVRCGTNFLLIVMVMSIVFYAFISAFLPGIPIWGLVLSRILVIPLIAGVSYEIIRGAATRMENLFVRTLIRPGLLLQKVTTRKPSDDQCEVAIESLKAVFTEEQIQEVASRETKVATPSWQTVKYLHPDDLAA